MPGGENPLNQAIDAQQNAIKALEESQDNPDNLKQKLDQYQSLFFTTVDSTQSEFQTLSAKLNSSEAKDYLQQANSKIAAALLNIAEKGQTIKKAKGEGAESIDTLASTLRSQLVAEEAEIKNFAAIEQVDSDNDKIDTDANQLDPDKIAKSKNDLISKLPVSAGSMGLKEKVAQKIRDSLVDLSVFKADQTLIKLTDKDVASLESLSKLYEKQSTDETKAQIDQLLGKLDFTKLGDDIFKDKIGNNPNPLTSRLYQKLWSEQFEPMKNRFEEAKTKIEQKEKDTVTAQAKVALGVVDQIWQQQIAPKLAQYTIKSDQGNLDLEKGLLVDLLKTRTLLGPFSAHGEKIEAGSFGMLTTRIAEVDSNIRKIETNRETRKNDVLFSSKGLLKYVKFINEGGDDSANGQVYNLTPEFYKLSPEEQILVKAQIEQMAAENKKSVRSETEKANLEFLKPEEKMKKLAELMGDKGKPYFAALEKVKTKDMEGAVKEYQKYLAQTFSPEEMNINKEFIEEAKKNIEGCFGEKLNEVDALFSDIKELKFARQKMVGNAELKPEDGATADVIESEIKAFHKDITDGKVLNFDARFNQLKANVTAALAQKKTAESDVLSKLEHLHELSRETDPVKRKQGFVEFATEARKAQGYNLARKYLDYALEQEFKEASKQMTRPEVMKKMLAEPEFLNKLNQEAGLRFTQMLKENPELKGQLTLDVVKEKMFNQALDSRYRHELRRSITPADFNNGQLEKYDNALALYNNWFPLDQPSFYDVLNYGAEEYDEFQVDCVKFVFEQMPSLGIGVAAGAMGKVGGKLAGKAVGKYLMRAGLAEGEALLIEQGGLQALKASLKSGKALSYGATRLLGTLALEGSTMYGLGLAHEYLQTGQVADFRSPGENIAEHLAESMAKVAVFKGIGVATSSIKPLSAAIQKGGVTGKLAWLGSETLSGAGGVALDASLAKIKGHDFTGQEAFQSMISNYFIAMGMGIAHGSGHSESRETQKLQKAVAKEREAFAKTRGTEAGELPQAKSFDESRFVTSFGNDLDNPPVIFPVDKDKAARAFAEEFVGQTKDLTPEESDVLNHYVGDSTEANQRLRGKHFDQSESFHFGKLSDAEFEANMRSIDSVINKGGILNKDTVLYRVVPIHGLEIADFERNITKGDPAFVSTTFSRTRAEDALRSRGGILMEIRIPKGAHVAQTGQTIELEVILGRNIPMKIVKKTTSGDNPVYTVEAQVEIDAELGKLKPELKVEETANVARAKAEKQAQKEGKQAWKQAGSEYREAFAKTRGAEAESHLKQMGIDSGKPEEFETKTEIKTGLPKLDAFLKMSPEEKALWAKEPITEKEMYEYFSTEALSKLPLEDYIALMRHFPNEMVTHVSRRGVRDHAELGEHKIGFGEYSDNFDQLLESHHVQSKVSTEMQKKDMGQILEDQLDLSKLKTREEAQEALNSLMDQEYNGYIGDHSALHVGVESVADRYYGAESGNEVFIVFPSALIDREYKYNGTLEHSNPGDATRNDTSIWSMDNHGLSLDAGIVFLPREARVNPQTGSKYELDANKKPILATERLAQLESLENNRDFAIFLTEGRNKMAELENKIGSRGYKNVAAQEVFDAYKIEFSQRLQKDFGIENAEMRKMLIEDQGMGGGYVSGVALNLGWDGSWKPSSPEILRERSLQMLRDHGLQFKLADKTVSSKEFWDEYFNKRPERKPSKIVYYEGDNPTEALMKWRKDNGIDKSSKELGVNFGKGEINSSKDPGSYTAKKFQEAAQKYIEDHFAAKEESKAAIDTELGRLKPELKVEESADVARAEAPKVEETIDQGTTLTKTLKEAEIMAGLKEMEFESLDLSQLSLTEKKTSFPILLGGKDAELVIRLSDSNGTKSFRFDIRDSNNVLQLTGSIFVTGQDQGGHLVETVIKRTSPAEDKFLPPGAGVVLYRKMLSFTNILAHSSGFEGAFTHRITRQPDISRRAKPLTNDRWNQIFAPILTEFGYQNIGEGSWEKEYHPKSISTDKYPTEASAHPETAPDHSPNSPQLRLTRTLDSLTSSEKQLYTESKVIQKPVLNPDGTPKLDAQSQPVTEELNLFGKYESKTYAYSKEFLADLSHEKLTAQGGCKVIKLGGDELLVLHAGPAGTIQKLFIDISNMGPTNDTATNLTGSKVNLVDIFLYKISESIKSESSANQGKYLNEAKFNEQITAAGRELFSMDYDAAGKQLEPEDAKTNFDHLKKEWHLEGDYATYKTDVASMRILAEYRADTRGLDASFKNKEGVSFSEHISGEIRAISGMEVADLQKLITENPEHFKTLIKERQPQSSKLKAMSPDEMMVEISKLDAKTSRPEDLMMLYSLMARINTTSLTAGHPAFDALAENLNAKRAEIIGEPPHPRVEAPRLMDAKVVSIDIPQNIATALQTMNPVEAQAILTAARTLAEHPLDSLKYNADKTKFAKFNILDHVEIVDGKVIPKTSAQEFREAYEINLQDKKVSNIADIESTFASTKKLADSTRELYEKGQIDSPTFEARMKTVEAAIQHLQDRLTIDPDTGAYGQAYMDVSPTHMYAFPEGSISPIDRIWQPVVTELSHAGAINSKYGYLGMDKMMSAYCQVLKTNISSQLPPNLQHFKVIRSGGGKFEVVFLDSRSVASLKQKGLTPESLIKQIAEGPGQTEVEKILSADPAALERTRSDAAVRNSQFKYNKGTAELEVGKLTIKSEIPISHDEILTVLQKNPNASQREIIGQVMRGRAEVAKANEETKSAKPKADITPEIRQQTLDALRNARFDEVKNIATELEKNIDAEIKDSTDPEKIRSALTQYKKFRGLISDYYSTPEIGEVITRIEAESNRLIMKSSGAEIQKSWDLLLKEFPLLSKLQINEGKISEAEVLSHTAGYFSASGFGKSTITIMPSNPEHYQRLLETRKASVKLVAERLGIPSENMTPELLKTFIILHELGHGQDFLSSGIDIKTWTENPERNTLPVPGLNPPNLKNAVHNGTLRNNLDSIKDPATRDLAEKALKGDQTSLNRLMDNQEKAYKELPSEKYADDFAANFIRQHAKEIGLSLGNEASLPEKSNFEYHP